MAEPRFGADLTITTESLLARGTNFGLVFRYALPIRSERNCVERYGPVHRADARVFRPNCVSQLWNRRYSRKQACLGRLALESDISSGHGYVKVLDPGLEKIEIIADLKADFQVAYTCGIRLIPLKLKQKKKVEPDFKADIKADKDRGGDVSAMEPLLVGDGSRHRRELTELAFELGARSAGFRRSLPKSLLESLADLVRAMNCY